jgi:hypothetical protein
MLDMLIDAKRFDKQGVLMYNEAEMLNELIGAFTMSGKGI